MTILVFLFLTCCCSSDQWARHQVTISVPQSVLTAMSMSQGTSSTLPVLVKDDRQGIAAVFGDQDTSASLHATKDSFDVNIHAPNGKTTAGSTAKAAIGAGVGLAASSGNPAGAAAGALLGTGIGALDNYQNAPKVAATPIATSEPTIQTLNGLPVLDASTIKLFKDLHNQKLLPPQLENCPLLKNMGIFN